MKKKIEAIGKLFAEMVDNYNTFGDVWKNIPLAKEAFRMMKELPPTVPGEFDTPAEKASLLGQMLDHMSETMTPRLCIEVREYMQSLNADDSDNAKALAKLRDFIDTNLPMEEYCKRHRRHLKFDPVERTPLWEEKIYEVEKECDRRLDGEPRCMGFCFIYWSTMRDVLAEHGIEWMSPGMMNPGVMFD